MTSPSRRDLANAIRILAMDAVQAANSGHPGMPMGMADIAEVLWNDYLNHNPGNPKWFNRDRFVLSNGHASVLQYIALHLTGYDLGIDDLKQQRQWGSITPGHPEHFLTPGVEVTTGPLGQGVGNAVGVLTFTVFTVAMTTGRMFGTRLLDRFGRVLVLRTLAVVALAGLLLVIVGGLLYTFGGVVYGLKRPNPSPQWFGFHEVFHSFTVLAFAAANLPFLSERLLGLLPLAGGKVLMLGAPLDRMTLLHHAEHVANFPNKRIRRYEAPILVDGMKTWRWFEEFDTSNSPDGMPEDYFATIVEAFLATGDGRRGVIGEAQSVLVDATRSA